MKGSFLLVASLFLGTINPQLLLYGSLGICREPTKRHCFWKRCRLKMNLCPFLENESGSFLLSRRYQDLSRGLNPDRWNHWLWSNSNIQLPLCIFKFIEEWFFDCNTFLCVHWTFVTWPGHIKTFSELSHMHKKPWQPCIPFWPSLIQFR